jgi:predicted extracellular nuclease
METGVSAGVLINGDNLGVVQSGGQSNTAAVVTAGSTEDLARVVGNIDWLVGELRKIGTTEQDIGDLETKLQVTPVAQQRQVVEAWQHGLVKRVSDLLGQGMAGIMANLLSPILARFLGLG